MVTGEIWFVYLPMRRSCPSATHRSWPTASFLAYSAALPQATTTRSAFFLSNHTHLCSTHLSSTPNHFSSSLRSFRIELLLDVSLSPYIFDAKQLLELGLEVISVLIFFGYVGGTGHGTDVRVPRRAFGRPRSPGHSSQYSTNPNLRAVACLPHCLPSSHVIFLG